MKKTADQLLQETEQSLQKRIKAKEKLLADLNVAYDHRVKTVEDEFLHRKSFLDTVLASSEKEVIATQARVDKLTETEARITDLITKREGLLKTLTERHHDISVKLLAELLALQKDVDAMKEQHRSSTANFEALEARYKVLSDECIALQEKKEELEKEVDDLDILSAVKEHELSEATEDVQKLHQTAKQYRLDFDAMADDKKLLAIRLHDANVLEYRLKPEFQTLLKRYLDKH